MKKLAVVSGKLVKAQSHGSAIASVVDAVKAVDQAFIRMAQSLNIEGLTPTEVALSFDKTKDWEGHIEAFSKALKARILGMLKEYGEKVTEAGTLRARIGGEYELEARPARTGHDPKKVEPALRKKGLRLAEWMEQVVTYKVDEAKLVAACEAGYITSAELDACKFDESYAIQRPKRLSTP